MADAPPTSRFDGLADPYDALIDWPRRLMFEGPFFRNLFESHSVRRVADIACGTGHHAAMFHSWGLDVEGSDISQPMLDKCRCLHGAGEHLQWVKRSFLEPPQRPGTFDAVVCIGNSIALADDLAAVRRAVQNMVATVRVGGTGVIQILNLGAIPEGPIHWQKVRRRDDGDCPGALLKGVHRVGDRGFVDLVELMLPETGVEWKARTMTFLGLQRAEIEAMLHAGGATTLAVHGGYGLLSFDENHSPDLIVVWKRGPRSGGA